MAKAKVFIFAPNDEGGDSHKELKDMVASWSWARPVGTPPNTLTVGRIATTWIGERNWEYVEAELDLG